MSAPTLTPTPTLPRRRRSSTTSNHIYRPPSRPAVPTNPPEPPPTLLHPSTSSHDDPGRERVRRELDRATSRGSRRRSIGRLEEGDGEETVAPTPIGRNGTPKQDTSGPVGGKRQTWYIRWVKVWGKGMWHDVRNRTPYYMSDWTDAWNYRVVPATWVRAFFSWL